MYTSQGNVLTLSVALPVLSLIAILQARPPETLPPSRTNWTRLVPLPVLTGHGRPPSSALQVLRSLPISQNINVRLGIAP